MKCSTVVPEVLVTSLLLAGCMEGARVHATMTPTRSGQERAVVFFSSGSVTVPGRAAPDSATGVGATVCVATRTFRDIRRGAPVTVTGRDGETLGSAMLDFGGFDADAHTCTFAFSFGRIVADGSSTFEVHVGAAARAPVAMSEQQLAAGAEIRLFR